VKRCIWIRNSATYHIYVRELTGYQYAYISRAKRKVDGEWTKTWYVHVKPADNPMGCRYMTSTDTLNDAKRIAQLICASIHQTETRTT
jgi:hypothetical protein